MKKIVLFGAGKIGQRFLKLIKYLGGKVDFFSDNDKEKAGLYIEGIEVISVDSLMHLDCYIIIANCDIIRTRNQLKELGLQDKEMFLENYLKSIRNVSEELEIANQEETVCIDLFSAASWGGTENWAWTVGNALSEKFNVIIKKFEDSTINELIEEYKIYLPIVFITNFYTENYLAALALKIMYPDKVRIFNVLHGDVQYIYGRSYFCNSLIEKYIAVSKKIAKTMVEIYGIEEEKLCCIHQPVSFDFNFNKEENLNNPIRIGMALRLVKERKRAHLIPEVIESLEKGNIAYILSIAGDGPVYKDVQEYINRYRLQSKVRLYGFLEKPKMQVFWKKQDIFINISDSEGACLSMLEAMGYGCVPIVTDVSGTRDYIEDGKNGYIVPIDELERIGKLVEHLDNCRAHMISQGKAAQELILKECRIDSVIDEFAKNLERNENN